MHDLFSVRRIHQHCSLSPRNTDFLSPIPLPATTGSAPKRISPVHLSGTPCRTSWGIYQEQRHATTISASGRISPEQRQATRIRASCRLPTTSTVFRVYTASLKSSHRHASPIIRHVTDPTQKTWSRETIKRYISDLQWYMYFFILIVIFNDYIPVTYIIFCVNQE